MIANQQGCGFNQNVIVPPAPTIKNLKEKIDFRRLLLCHNVGYENAPIHLNITFSQNCVNQNVPTINFTDKMITK
jgi:hypothetical protein